MDRKIPSKKCFRCKIEKTLDFFNKRGLKVGSYCSPCNQEYCKEMALKYKFREPIEVLDKMCIHCKETKVISCFPIRRQSPDGYNQTCKTCVNLVTKKNHQQNKLKPRIVTREFKSCYICKVLKTSDGFSRNFGNYDKLSSECRSCSNQKDLKRRLKIKLAAFNSLGGNQCVACGVVELEFLTLQHKLGGGGKHFANRDVEGVYKDVVNDPDRSQKYEVLCANCNTLDSKRRVFETRSDSKGYQYKHRDKLRSEAFKLISNDKVCCNCCGDGFDDIQKLSVDHIIPFRTDSEGPRSGTELHRWVLSKQLPEETERRRKKFQLLCHNCNKSKGVGDVCIHKRKSASELIG